MAAEGDMLRYWRVLVVGVLGAALAFASSFLVSPVYQSSTRLIIHGQDANFLYSSGQNDPSKASITDATQATALAETYGAIATSRSLAIRVVNDLHLAAPKHDSGVLHALAGTAATAYRCTRAFLTSGYCAAVNRREQAINNVQAGTTALQLGTTAGASAGNPGAYVLEITSSGDSPTQARDITNTVANELVIASSQQVRNDAGSYVAKLRAQLARVTSEANRGSSAVTSYERIHHISAADQQTVQTSTSFAEERTSLRGAKADLSAAQAQLAAITTALTTTPPTTASDQHIHTGRSTTTVTTNEVNPAYTSLVAQRTQAQGNIGGLQAKVRTLQSQVASGSPAKLSKRLSQLSELQTASTSAQQSESRVSAQLQQARTQLGTAQPDLGRLDVAGRPQYPVSPARYLYLFIGLLLGALVGGGLTWLAGRRRGPEPVGPIGPEDADDERGDADLDEDETSGPTIFGLSALPIDPVPVGVSSNGNGHHADSERPRPSDGPNDGSAGT